MTEPSAQSWLPAFIGQREPFRAGNAAAVTHGARSSRIVDPVAAEIAAELLAQPDLPEYLRRPEFAPAVAAWARAEARCELLAGWLSTMDASGPGDDKVMSVLGQLHRVETAAARMRSDLGLTPVAAARLNRDVSASRYMATSVMAGIERLAATGAELVARDLAAIEASQSRAEPSEGGSDAEPA
jgi:hypothetical protein